MALSYFQRDERPAWQATITVNGVSDDYSSGYTFTVTVADKTGAAVLTKTTGITGATGGVVNVAWAPDELDLDPGLYSVQLTVKRSGDLYEETVSDQLQIRQRSAA